MATTTTTTPIMKKLTLVVCSDEADLTELNNQLADLEIQSTVTEPNTRLKEHIAEPLNTIGLRFIIIGSMLRECINQMEKAANQLKTKFEIIIKRINHFKKLINLQNDVKGMTNQLKDWRNELDSPINTRLHDLKHMSQMLLQRHHLKCITTQRCLQTKRDHTNPCSTHTLHSLIVVDVQYPCVTELICKELERFNTCIWWCSVTAIQPYRCVLSHRDSAFDLQFTSMMDLFNIFKAIAFPPSTDLAQNHPLQILNCTNDFPVYKMTQQVRGVCMVINNADYSESSGMEKREGSDKDVKNLKSIFNEMFFDIEVFENLTDSGIITEIKKMSTQNHSQYDCFVCCILAHGGRGTITGVNGKDVALEEITSHFRVRDCPTLGEKPKLFFVQACQGSRTQRGVVQFQRDVNRDDSPLTTIADGADFFMACSTEPGFVSFRNPLTGSLFIESLCEKLHQYKHNELSSILRKVCAEVSDITSEDNIKQVPWTTSTLTKELFLRPLYRSGEYVQTQPI